MRALILCFVSFVILASGCSQTPPPKKVEGPTAEDVEKAKANLQPGQSLAQ